MTTFINLLILVSFLFGILYFYYKQKYNYWKKRKVSFKKPSLIFGNFLDIAFSKYTVARYFVDLYNNTDGPYFGFYCLSRPYLLIKDVNLIKNILIKDFNSFSNRIFFVNEKIDPIISNAINAIKTPHWKYLRKKLSPIFTPKQMKEMSSLIIECSKNLEKHISNNLSHNLDMKEIAAKYTTDVIASCMFGLDVNSFTKNSEFQLYGKLLFPNSLLSNLMTSTYLYAPFLVQIFKYPLFNKKVVGFFCQVFKETLNIRKLTKTKRNDLIDMLIEIKDQETNNVFYKFEGNRLFAQPIIFYAAGHETTSSTIAFTLHELGVNPDIQSKVREEINKKVDKNGEITYEAIQDMKYLHMVISETLRKYPTTLLINRECTENYFIPQTGLVIEKGTPVVISQLALHYDPKYFPNPQNFDPERFSDENKQTIPAGAYLPFGDGPRNCIGERLGLLTVKFGIVSIVKSFQVVRNPNTKEPIVFECSLFPQLKYGVPLSCIKLEHIF
ncbi:hypothetical protein FQA39_LY09785 [Lamprigera yunnana]|nr:hypothetical protein FQA39_LY09785 [Lamprigera yunnana]